MSSVIDARDALYAALRTVPKLTVYKDPGATIDPPGAVIGPPRLTWAHLTPVPTEATFPVYYVVAADEHAVGNLYGDRLQVIVDAIHTYDRAAITGTANPFAYPASGGVDLPALEISVDVALL